MSIYDQIAASILPILPSFSVGGSSWTVTRLSTGNGVTGAVTTASAGTKTLYFIRNTVDSMGINLAGTALASAEWLCFARLGVDIRVNDVCTSVDDTTRAFRIIGAPQNDFGLLLAPVAVAQPVAAGDSLFLLESGDSLLLESGDLLLLEA